MTVDLTRLSDRTPRGIAGAVSRAIRLGELAPGERLPTVRDVAAGLGVSPATVSAAWQALRRTGLVDARGRAGTFVRAAPTPWLSPRVQRLVGDDATVADDVRLDLSRGMPDPDLLPDLGPALGRVSARAGTLAYHDEPVLPGLRDVLADGWRHPVDAVTVVDGATDGIARVLEQVVSYGDRVVLESPGFPPLFDLVEALGAEVVPVGLDGEGVRPDALRRALEARPVAVVLQPRAHNPAGVSLSAERAEALARVLGRRRDDVPWVVEDDHSGAICTAPEVSLAPWLPARVVQVRSYSKSHGPDLRLAALGGPSGLLDRIVARRMLGPAWSSRMLQSILLDLLTTPESVADVDGARDAYAARQQALAGHLGLPTPDGINLWLPVRDERAAVLHLAAAGIRVATGSAFVTADDAAPAAPAGDHVRVTAGLVPVAEAAAVAADLARAALVD
ncbi:aminotransferase class I/II-fold pyridoxal phosphate-dependent enzyme [Nocardioides marinquilinus]|uniref:Aminotransferase class I/II-fold pyridoxal phosphate-dependent enzyme n=1 Tax=Nocardioides marinquilinus TaxID=1210400 RepID=A0ABP9P849_9ACTN